MQASNVELSATHVFARQVALDCRDSFPGKLKATEFGQVTLGSLQESHRIQISLRLNRDDGFVLKVCQEVADQYLSGQRCIDHARQFDGYIADDEVVHGRVESLGLVELVASTDVKAGAQPGYSL